MPSIVAEIDVELSDIAGPQGQLDSLRGSLEQLEALGPRVSDSLSGISDALSISHISSEIDTGTQSLSSFSQMAEQADSALASFGSGGAGGLADVAGQADDASGSLQSLSGHADEAEGSLAGIDAGGIAEVTQAAGEAQGELAREADAAHEAAQAEEEHGHAASEAGSSIGEMGGHAADTVGEMLGLEGVVEHGGSILHSFAGNAAEAGEGLAALGPEGAVAAAGIAAVSAGFESFKDDVNILFQMSQRFGITTAEAQGLRTTFMDAGLSADMANTMLMRMQLGLVQVQRAMDAGKEPTGKFVEGLHHLGIEINAFMAANPSTQIQMIMEGFQRVGENGGKSADGVRAAVIATELFSRSGAGAVAALQQLNGSYGENVVRAQELGIASDTNVQKFLAWQKASTELHESLSSIAVGIGGAVAPVVTQLAHDLDKAADATRHLGHALDVLREGGAQKSIGEAFKPSEELRQAIPLIDKYAQAMEREQRIIDEHAGKHKAAASATQEKAAADEAAAKSAAAHSAAEEKLLSVFGLSKEKIGGMSADLGMFRQALDQTGLSISNVEDALHHFLTAPSAEETQAAGRLAAIKTEQDLTKDSIIQLTGTQGLYVAGLQAQIDKSIEETGSAEKAKSAMQELHTILQANPYLKVAADKQIYIDSFTSEQKAVESSKTTHEDARKQLDAEGEAYANTAPKISDYEHAASDAQKKIVDLGNAQTGLGRTSADSFGELEKARLVTADYSTSVKQAGSDAKAAGADVKAAGSDVKAGGDSVKSGADAGAEGLADLKSKGEASVHALQEAVMGTLLEMATNVSQEAFAIGAAIDSGISNGLVSGEGTVTSIAAGVVRAAVAAAHAAEGGAPTPSPHTIPIGLALGDGIGKGIADAGPGVAGAGEALITTATAVLNKLAAPGGPVPAAAKHAGKAVGEAHAEGVKDTKAENQAAVQEGIGQGVLAGLAEIAPEAVAAATSLAHATEAPLEQGFSKGLSAAKSYVSELTKILGEQNTFAQEQYKDLSQLAELQSGALPNSARIMSAAEIGALQAGAAEARATAIAEIQAKQNYREQIFAIDQQLLTETDASNRAQLENKRAMLAQELNDVGQNAQAQVSYWQQANQQITASAQAVQSQWDKELSNFTQIKSLERQIAAVTNEGISNGIGVVTQASFQADQAQLESKRSLYLGYLSAEQAWAEQLKTDLAAEDAEAAQHDENMIKYFAQLAQEAGQDFEAIRQKASQEFQALESAGKSAADGVASSMKGAMQAITSAQLSVAAFQMMSGGSGGALAGQAMANVSWSNPFTGSFNQPVGNAGGGPGSPGAAASAGRKAAGGPAQGLFWVGEEGPELMYSGGPVHVIPNGTSMAMAGGAPGFAKGTGFQTVYSWDANDPMQQLLKSGMPWQQAQIATNPNIDPESGEFIGGSDVGGTLANWGTYGPDQLASAFGRLFGLRMQRILGLRIGRQLQLAYASMAAGHGNPLGGLAGGPYGPDVTWLDVYQNMGGMNPQSQTGAQSIGGVASAPGRTLQLVMPDGKVIGQVSGEALNNDARGRADLVAPGV